MRLMLNEDVYSPNSVFVDTSTGKRYSYQNGKFVEIKQPKPSKKSKKDKDKEKDQQQQNKEQEKSNDSSKRKPQIGDKPDEDDEITKAEEEERQRQAAEDAANGEGETEEEREKRLAELDKLLNDEETSQEIDKETEDNVYKSRKRKTEYERKKQLAQYKAQDNLSGFPRSLDNFIKNEVAATKVSTYKKMNKTYNANTGNIIRRGHMKRKDGHIPSINVYYDQSGSWGPEDIELGNQAISVLKKYVDKGEVTVDIYYFANDVTDYPPGGGGTEGEPVMQHIRQTKPDNVIIMTDSDTNYDKLTPYTVPGGVWFLWKNGQSSQAFRNALKGKKSTKEFNIRQKG